MFDYLFVLESEICCTFNRGFVVSSQFGTCPFVTMYTFRTQPAYCSKLRNEYRNSSLSRKRFEPDVSSSFFSGSFVVVVVVVVFRRLFAFLGAFVVVVVAFFVVGGAASSV